LAGKPTYKDLEHKIRMLEEEAMQNRQKENELRQSEAKYRLLVENSYDVIWALNADLLLTYISPSLKRILGYESSTMIGKPFQQIVHPDDVALCEYYLRQAIKTREYVTGPEYRIRHADGTWQWHVAGGNAVFADDGSLTYLIGFSCDVTERKLAQEELIWKTAFLEAQVEATLDGILVVDSRGRRILANQHILDIWKVPQHIRDEQDDKLLLHYVASLTRHPEQFLEKVIYLYNHPDETSRDEIEFTDGTILDRYTSSVLGKDGIHYGRIWTFRDITERRRAEEALRESQQQLSYIINFLPDATFVIDQEGRVIAWNLAIEEMTGIRAADILGKGNYEYALPFYGERRPILVDLVLKPQEEVEAGYVSTLRGNNVLEGEAYMPALRGGEVYLYGKASILRDSRGNTVGAIESIRDVTDRRRAEEKYKAIFENAVMGIYQATPDGRIISANQAFASIIGYGSPEEVIEKVADIAQQLYVQPEQRNELMREMNEHGAVYDREINIFRKDGSMAWVTVNMRTVRDSGAKVLYYEGAIQEITERKSLEFQLRQAQKMEAIGTLAGGIAHDFNNILSAVIGYAEMARQEPDINEHLQRYLEQIYKAGIRAGELIRQILTFSRQTDEKLYPLKIGAIVKEVIKLLRASIPATIDINQRIECTADTVLANPTQIHQVMMNLCTNAVHAMDKGKGILQVGLASVYIKPDDLLIRQGLIPGMYVRLTVSDTGHGIAPAISDKIFDPFFTNKKPGEGTGMGLSVVHGIVKKCGGAVTLQSKEGIGTEFSVYFPHLRETEEEQQAEETAFIVGGKETILVVDDEEVLVDIETKMLTGLGYRVLGMTKSPEALELFRTRPDRFDLVITDMTMPKMTGFELVRELLLIRPDVPVILCTGFSELVTREQAMSLGFRDYIMKPIVLSQLAAAVRRVLDGK
jgi:PAS domain S-box-containing protein